MSQQDIDQALVRLFVARLRQGHFDHDPTVNPFANIPPRCVCGGGGGGEEGCVCGWVGCGEGAPLGKLWHAVGRCTLLGSTAATEQRNSALGGVLRENTTSQHSSASRRQAAILRSAEFFPSPVFSENFPAVAASPAAHWASHGPRGGGTLDSTLGAQPALPWEDRA